MRTLREMIMEFSADFKTALVDGWPDEHSLRLNHVDFGLIKNTMGKTSPAGVKKDHTMGPFNHYRKTVGGFNGERGVEFLPGYKKSISFTGQSIQGDNVSAMDLGNVLEINIWFLGPGLKSTFIQILNVYLAHAEYCNAYLFSDKARIAD